MSAPYRLSEAQIEQFHEQGFLIVRVDEHKLVDPIALRQWAIDVRCWPKEKGKWMPYEEVTASGERQIMRTEKYVDYHDKLRDLLCGPALSSVLAQLSGEEMCLFKDKINYKLSRGNGFKAHLDAPAYDHIRSLNPATRGAYIEHLTANIAIDAAIPANGCLEVVPGSHRNWESIPFSTGGHITESWEQEHVDQWVQVPLQPGDILFFGSHLAHRSGQNTTGGSRNSVYATYYPKRDGLVENGQFVDLRNLYYQDRREMFPPDHERIQGKDYSQGWERYAFAAPFTNPGMTATKV